MCPPAYRPNLGEAIDVRIAKRIIERGSGVVAESGDAAYPRKRIAEEFDAFLD
jgi:hypothetical protein